MCQMCDEYDAELRRMGIAADGAQVRESVRKSGPATRSGPMDTAGWPRRPGMVSPMNISESDRLALPREDGNR